jgi:hypothetical protein
VAVVGVVGPTGGRSSVSVGAVRLGARGGCGAQEPPTGDGRKEGGDGCLGRGGGVGVKAGGSG